MASLQLLLHLPLVTFSSSTTFSRSQLTSPSQPNSHLRQAAGTKSSIAASLKGKHAFLKNAFSSSLSDEYMFFFSIVKHHPLSAAGDGKDFLKTVDEREELSLNEAQEEHKERESTDEKQGLNGSKSAIGPVLASIYTHCHSWHWRGHRINYVVQGEGCPVVLIHGFGASIGHWRKNIPEFAKEYKVFALDLLGLGASEKPLAFAYSIETWAEMVDRFLEEVVGQPAVLVGNSIGSLVALAAAAGASEGWVRGVALLNCAGGLNNKAITDDYRIWLALPIFALVDWLLSKPSIARAIFNSVKTKDNVRQVLKSVYCNKEAVDDELLEIILKPAEDAGALDAFVSIITGPPGPRPETLIPKISSPIILIWGDEDPFTPSDGPIGKYFKRLPEEMPNVQFVEVANVGHCPHDDRPEVVHAALLPWLAMITKE